MKIFSILSQLLVDRLSGEDKQDVLDSMLLAQLAANKKIDREEQTKERYSYYSNVLQNVGWIIQEMQFAKYNTTDATFTMDKVALELLAQIAGQAETDTEVHGKSYLRKTAV